MRASKKKKKEWKKAEMWLMVQEASWLYSS